MAGANLSSLQFRIAAAAIGALIFIACTTFTVFGMRKLNEEQEQIDKLDRAIAAAQKKIDEIPKLQKRLETLRTEFNVDTQILPDEAEVEEFIDSLYTSRSQGGIPPGSVSPVQSSTSQRDAEKLPFEKKAWNLKFIADFFQMAEFVNAIENHKRFMQVDSFNVKAGEFDPQTAPSATVRNDVTMQISTFLYKSPTAKKGETE